MAQITINIPDDLAQRLQQFQAQLPQMLKHGLQEWQSQQRSAKFLDEQDIILLLASQPTPEQILAIRPSQNFRHRSATYYPKAKPQQKVKPN